MSKRHSLAVSLLSWLLISATLVRAQTPAEPSVSTPTASQAIESYRIPLDNSGAEPPLSSGRLPGSTGIPIPAVLTSVARGQEPNSLAQLKSLERQQVEVSAKAISVTVNILQGGAQGSGVIISPDGFVLTAAHVAGRPGKQVRLTLADGRTVRGRTLGMNRNVDAGLIQIVEGGSNWPHATIGESSQLRLGQWVIASGHPGGLQKERPPVIRVGRLINTAPSTLVTDCTLIGGDSGGPLFDLAGRLIGIHSRIGTDFSENMHVPIDMYREGWTRMVASESWGTLPGFDPPLIGVHGYPTGPDAATATIESVVPGGPADEAGIQKGDVILEYEDAKIGNFEELVAAVEGSIPGDRVRLLVRRGDQLMRKSLVVGAKVSQ